MSQIRHIPVAPTHTRSLAGGQVIERHRHDDHQLIYVSRGVLAITTRDGSWVAANDRALWVPAHTWHEHRFYGQSSFHTIGFPVDRPLLPTATPAVIAVDALLRELLVALTGPSISATETRHIHALLRDRLHRARAQPVSLPAPRDARLASACGLVESDLGSARTLSWLAQRVNVSERTLSRLFRAEFGMTYPQWRNRVRIFTAMLLLAEGASVTQTAHACGWATTSAFVHTFASMTGSTPGAHRAVSTGPAERT